VIASIEAGKWNEMQFFIGKCAAEKDLEKLKELRGRNIKENVAKALDQYFADLQSKRGKR
jgi:DNA-binding protein Fis